MIRTGSIIILILSVFFMIKGISETWKSRLGSLPDVAKKQQEVTPEKTEPELTFNPVVPQTLPDLKSGYLFNADRLLAEEENKDVEPQTDMSASAEGVKTNIDDVTYSGAIITDTFRWAIITYSAAPPPAKVDKKKRTSRRRRVRKPTSKTSETTKVMEGDFVGGYKVASIESDRIIFTKADTESVEKYIYDPNKNRAKPPARKVAATKIPARPSVPSGGAQSLAASAPSSKLAAKNPFKTAAARRTTTGRRLVVSRKPPARPNTSRVSRRRRSSGGAIGAPPVSGPPIPGHP